MSKNQNATNQNEVNSSIEIQSATPFITAVGSSSLTSATGINNTALGYQAGKNTSSGHDNLFLGTGCGAGCTTAIHSVGVGPGALAGVLTLAASTGNVAVGYIALAAVTGTLNTGIGNQALTSLTSGGTNTAVGVNAGNNYTSSESSNIVIGSRGVLAENNTIRIGTQGSGVAQQNKTFIAGITGVTPTSGNTPQVVLCDNAGNLAPISSSTSGFVLTSNGTATPSFQQSPAVSSWIDQGTSITVAVGTGYFSTAAVTLTLPAAPAQGNTVAFIADTASALIIQANTGQTIRLGSSTSSVAGAATNSQRGDGMTLVYRSADTTWLCWNSPTGTWNLT